MTGIVYAMGQTAQNSGAQGAASGWVSFLPIILMILIFYLILIRPQQKKEKERKKMIESLQKGDRVLTAGGIYGVIDTVKDDLYVIKIASNAKVEFSKSAIQAKIS